MFLYLYDKFSFKCCRHKLGTHHMKVTNINNKFNVYEIYRKQLESMSFRMTQLQPRNFKPYNTENMNASWNIQSHLGTAHEHEVTYPDRKAKHNSIKLIKPLESQRNVTNPQTIAEGGSVKQHKESSNKLSRVERRTIHSTTQAFEKFDSGNINTIDASSVSEKIKLFPECINDKKVAVDVSGFFDNTKEEAKISHEDKNNIWSSKTSSVENFSTNTKLNNENTSMNMTQHCNGQRSLCDQNYLGVKLDHSFEIPKTKIDIQSSRVKKEFKHLLRNQENTSSFYIAESRVKNPKTFKIVTGPKLKLQSCSSPDETLCADFLSENGVKYTVPWPSYADVLKKSSPDVLKNSNVHEQQLCDLVVNSHDKLRTLRDRVDEKLTKVDNQVILSEAAITKEQTTCSDLIKGDNKTDNQKRGFSTKPNYFHFQNKMSVRNSSNNRSYEKKVGIADNLLKNDGEKRRVPHTSGRGDNKCKYVLKNYENIEDDGGDKVFKDRKVVVDDEKWFPCNVKTVVSQEQKTNEILNVRANTSQCGPKFTNKLESMVLKKSERLSVRKPKFQHSSMHGEDTIQPYHSDLNDLGISNTLRTKNVSKTLSNCRSSSSKSESLLHEGEVYCDHVLDFPSKHTTQVDNMMKKNINNADLPLVLIPKSYSEYLKRHSSGNNTH